jgi:hypothetical protein
MADAAAAQSLERPPEAREYIRHGLVAQAAGPAAPISGILLVRSMVMRWLLAFRGDPFFEHEFGLAAERHDEAEPLTVETEALAGAQYDVARVPVLRHPCDAAHHADVAAFSNPQAKNLAGG